MPCANHLVVRTNKYDAWFVLLPMCKERISQAIKSMAIVYVIVFNFGSTSFQQPNICKVCSSFALCRDLLQLHHTALLAPYLRTQVSTDDSFRSLERASFKVVGLLFFLSKKCVYVFRICRYWTDCC